LNGDGQFQAGEEGALLARGGASISSFDPNLKQPYTDEFIVSLEREVIPNLRLSVTGTVHRERNLYGPVDVGVPASAFAPVNFVDPGADGVVGTADDQTLTAYNQDASTLGQNRFVFTNSPALDQDYKGLEVTVNKRFSNRWLLLAGYTYGKATQNNTYVGQFGGSTGGFAINNPNYQVNASGATFYDRPHTFKLTGSYLFKYDIQVSGNVRVQSGTAWSNSLGYPLRVVNTPSGLLNQGVITLFATAPGDLRTPTIKTVDLRAAKIFKVRDRNFEASVDIYNLFNAATAYDVNPVTGVSRVVNPVSGAVNQFPSYGLPSGILGPRIVRLGVKFTF
jgi:hypothetical protein